MDEDLKDVNISNLNERVKVEKEESKEVNPKK